MEIEIYNHLALTIVVYDDKNCDLYYSNSSLMTDELAKDITPNCLGEWLKRSIQLCVDQKYRVKISDYKILFRTLCENETHNASHVFVTKYIDTPLSMKIDFTRSLLAEIDWIYVCNFRKIPSIYYSDNPHIGNFSIQSIIETMLNSNILGVEVKPTQTSNTVPCDVCTLREHDDCMRFINNKYICDDCMEKYNKVKSIVDDDSKSVEMSALMAIQDSINHVHTLYTILLTDGMSCGKEYRDRVGLDDLLTIKEKLKRRIIELDDSIEDT